MNEREWVDDLANVLRDRLTSRRIRIETGLRLPYGYEISAYGETREATATEFQTDLAIIEDLGDGAWLPRVIVEAKIDTITTHDAITYSRKADCHRTVHPYLRYGVMIGNRRDRPLPGRLYRHGTGFDFMISFQEFDLSKDELSTFVKIVKDEIRASRNLEKIIYHSRRPDRDHYTVFRRRLLLE